MEITSLEKWQEGLRNNREDEYGAAVYRYAERWADMMEVEIGEGNPFSEIAKQTSYDADTEGITGFMYGCAVAILSRVWRYGEELRVWHNLDTQIHDEGERANKDGSVLNPALMTIET